jgi:serine/threonine protein kinase
MGHMAASLPASASSQSLSSFLIPGDVKSARSSRVNMSVREELTDRSITGRVVSSLPFRGIAHSEHGVYSQPLGDDAFNTSTKKAVYQDALMTSCEVVAVLLLSLYSRLLSERPTVSILSSIRTLLEVCPIQDLSAVFFMVSANQPEDLVILKLICPHYFNNSYARLMETGVRVGSGCFGSVYHLSSQKADGNRMDLAVKRIAREQTFLDPCRILDVLNEVSCLKVLRQSQVGPSYLDFGVDHCEYWIVMECGYMNVKSWRHSLEANDSLSDNTLRLVMSLYLDILVSVEAMHDLGVVHFDIKCENVMLRRPPSLSPKSSLQVSPVFLIDFGESILLSEVARATWRSRGTLPIQSPELIALTHATADTVNTSCISSDIWSCGCLLGELLSGEFMFVNKSWMDLYALLCAEPFVVDVVNIYDMVRSLIGDMQLDASIYDGIGAIICRAMVVNPSSRGSLNELRTMTTSLLEKLPATHILPRSLSDAVNLTLPSACLLDEKAYEGVAVIPRGFLFISRCVVFSFGVPFDANEANEQLSALDVAMSDINNTTSIMSSRSLALYSKQFDDNHVSIISDDTTLISLSIDTNSAHNTLYIISFTDDIATMSADHATVSVARRLILQTIKQLMSHSFANLSFENVYWLLN